MKAGYFQNGTIIYTMYYIPVRTLNNRLVQKSITHPFYFYFSLPFIDYIYTL